MKTLSTILALVIASAASAAEYHVAVTGNDANDGTRSRPLKTIQAAAEKAQPGDVITVHEGVYRERVSPPRGGESDAKRITYQAAPGEKVTITGSEVVKGWEKVGGDTWKVTIPNKFFGDFNPYRDVIHGDWFNPHGRVHHTGAVYLNGAWLVEAASHLNEVLKPAGKRCLWFGRVDGAEDSDYLLNLAAITVGPQRIAAAAFAAKNGELRVAPNAEGGQCVGWIRAGSWLKFDKVNFGAGTESIAFRAASVTGGGDIEIRLNAADGELLGTCAVADTGDWHTWATFTAKIRPTRGEQGLCLVFRPHKPASANTTIWAQFPGVDPNAANVEINVRKTVFTPAKTGVNYITVRGFILRNAATNWAPPTAGQIGLVSAYWNKGWIIENNDIAYSKCSGVALGKYGDEWDNRAESPEGYVGTLTRALSAGWNKATVGGHVVRNNRIAHCEQTGVVGSLGCSFSTVTGNEIHDIHVQRLFSGAEMAGIKFHGAIDVVISGNHIYRCGSFGVWLDWMAQGCRVTGNLFHDNHPYDLFHEVDHGPYLVDNNVFLSPAAFLINSQGGAYVHNLIAGGLRLIRSDARMTPLHAAHSTAVVKLHNNPCGDMRFCNNVFVRGGDVSPYNKPTLPVVMTGNVFLKGAKPCRQEEAPLLEPDFDPAIKLTERPDGWYLELILKAWAAERSRKPVTGESLGKARIPGLAFENADGTPVRIDSDYFGTHRDAANPFPGPLEILKSGTQTIKVWPKP